MLEPGIVASGKDHDYVGYILRVGGRCLNKTEHLVENHVFVGYDFRIEWCAAFVSWCYYEAGADGPFFIAVNSEGIPWFEERGRFVGADYRDIAPGDCIFMDWEDDGWANHVGLVIGTDGEKVYTIEGNRSDACQQFAYDLDDPRIFGYGLMNWD